MDPDVLFVLGSIISILSIPAVVSAFTDRRTPRAPAILIVIGALAMTYAISERPGVYSFETYPDVFARVVGKFIN